MNNNTIKSLEIRIEKIQHILDNPERLSKYKNKDLICKWLINLRSQLKSEFTIITNL